MANKGVYQTTKKDGSTYYRVSITYRMKHISLGSYDREEIAALVYDEARAILDIGSYQPENYNFKLHIPFSKYISLLNFRDNGIYFPTPIYLRKQYFDYYLDEATILKFDRDDLFFYASHTICKKGGYLYYNDYGSQYKLLSRYGVKAFAVYGRDYEMVNGDVHDYRYSNIRILNYYTGVVSTDDGANTCHTVSIHINGNYIVGRYSSLIDAAIAYNKAVDTLHTNGFTKNYIKNYISELKKEEYLSRYSSIKISNSIIAARP